MIFYILFHFSLAFTNCFFYIFVHLLGAKLKPYIVFVAPPTNIETLKRVIASTYRGQEEGNNLPLNELQAIIDEARDIEVRFGHHFDKVLVVNDIESAYQELLKEINSLEREPQWIPSIWIK